MGITLYEIHVELQSIFREIEDGEGEVSGSLESRLTAIEAALDHKLEATCAYIKNSRATIEAYETEMERLRKLRDSTKARTDRLMVWVGNFIGPAGWTGGVHKISWRKSKSVDVPNVEALPIEFQRFTSTADKAAIKKELEAGVAVPGALLIERSNLQLK